MLLSILLIVAGSAALYLRLRGDFSRGVVLITIALLVGATPLFWYSFFEPSPADAALFALTAWLAFAAAFRVRPGTPSSPAWPMAAWVAIAALALFLARPSQILPTRVSDVFFSSWHGFLSWSPVAYIGVVGTIFYWRRDRAWTTAVLLVLLFWAWAIGTSGTWMSAPSLGNRLMMPTLALVAPGLALVLDTLRRRPAFALAPLVAAPLMWNHLLMVQYTVGMLPKDEPISFARMVRQQGDAYARGFRFYPFAFPANVWFAWREGVPVDRYDLVASEPRRSEIDLVMDRTADRFFLSGWESPTRDTWGPLWWVTGRSASLALPLERPRERDTVLVVQARTRFEEPTFEADLTLQVNGHDIGQFFPSASMPSESRFLVPAAAGTRIWREGLNRIAIVNRGAHRVDPSDTRPPGPLGKRTGNPPWPVAIYRIAVIDGRK